MESNMSQLPAIFIEQTRRLMGDERFERYLKSFEEEAPVSIRLNPRKTEKMEVIDGEQVPWCRDGYYLRQRPSFTMDPLLHAGCYYVQEAASMFLDEVLRQTVKTDNRLIDQSLKRQNVQSINRLIVLLFFFYFFILKSFPYARAAPMAVQNCENFGMWKRTP